MAKNVGKHVMGTRSNSTSNSRLLMICFLIIPFLNAFSQIENGSIKKESTSAKVDSLYREDQFYFNFTYNSLLKRPVGVSQEKFSTGLAIGFIRDMPVNKDRTLAVGSGLGFSYNNYNENLAIKGSGQMPTYSVIDAKASYSKNKITTVLAELPLELRWRTSTYESHKFWRIYGGVKFSYLLLDRSVVSDGSGKIIVSGNKDFNKFLYGLYLSSGYNTINVYAYYGLNSIFKKTALVNGEPIAMKSLNIGIVFYIL